MVSAGTKNKLIALLVGLAGALCSGQASAQMTPMPTPPVVDARRAMPMFPASGVNDGFFLQHSKVPDLGLYGRLAVYYGRDPLGTEQAVSDRVMLYPSAMLSILKWVDVGLAMPIVVYQRSTGLNVSATALGDLRLLTKLRIPAIPKSWPQLALSMDVGFPTGNAEARVGASQVSLFPRLIIDFLTIKNRLLLVGNIGGFLAGTGQSCPIENPDPMMMGGNTNNNNMMPCNFDATAAVAGLGNHLFWGVGANINVAPDIGMRVVTELVGSFSYTNQEGRSPLFWNVGIMRAKGNKWVFGAMYGLGLTPGSPGHTIVATLGYAWEHKEDAPEKKPELKVDVTVQMQPMPAPPGAVAPAPAPAPVPAAAPPPQGAPPAKAPAPAVPPTPVAPPPTTQSIDIEVPKDWWPKDDKDKK
jgi:hypothetical protein